ncbi:MAG: substrate-binding domain-containing protein [Actinomycetota bacterium]|nr:substrate-binding domain-containing protein [Actinomycetota bacterium]
MRSAAEKLSYVPHSAGQALRARRVGAVAVVVPHSTQHLFAHPVLIDLLEGIMSVANRRGLMTILSTSDDEDDVDSAYTRISRGRRADGVIVVAAAATDVHAAQLSRAGYPVVIVGRSPLVPSVSSFGVDDVSGAYDATRHLIERHGAARIAHVSGPLHHQSAVDKRDGFVAALRDAGLTLNPRLQFEGDHTEQSGWKAAQELLPLVDQTDAVFCANDQMAMGLLQALRDASVDVPSRLAIVGYDDHPVIRYAQPALATVGADMVRVGVEAAERLIEIIESGDAEPVHTLLPTHLLLRASCGCSSDRDPASP